MSGGKATRAWLGAGAVAVVALVAVFGLGYGPGGAATVSGRVTYRGQPVRIGTVLVEGRDGIARTAAIADGAYEVPGVPVGPCRVAVLSPLTAPAVGAPLPAKDVQGPGRPVRRTVPAGWVKLPERYGDPERSGLGCTVGRRATTYDVELN
jgi:hypothetical protein